jgi:hypothetical protein
MPKGGSRIPTKFGVHSSYLPQGSNGGMFSHMPRRKRQKRNVILFCEIID